MRKGYLFLVVVLSVSLSGCLPVLFAVSAAPGVYTAYRMNKNQEKIEARLEKSSELAKETREKSQEMMEKNAKEQREHELKMLQMEQDFEREKIKEQSLKKGYSQDEALSMRSR